MSSNICIRGLQRPTQLMHTDMAVSVDVGTGLAICKYHYIPAVMSDMLLLVDFVQTLFKFS